MDKLSVFSNNAGKERDVFFVCEDRAYLRKEATKSKTKYHPKIADYIEKAKPLPDLIQVLLTALGAGEFWNANVNSDYFQERMLSPERDDWGHKTFVTNANYFTHHVNKDPALAKGKVLHAVWNDGMKRVELIVGINPKLDPDASTSIDRGEDLAFSMGTKVPYDTCSICSNNAKTRDEYCDHMRYSPGQMDPASGKQIFVYNPFPRFFDISRVLIPADKTAYMWTKVAGAANPYAKFSSADLAALPPGKIADIPYLLKVAEEKAAGEKKADMIKQVPATVEKPKFIAGFEKTIPPARELLERKSKPLPPEVLKAILALAPTLGRLGASFAALGMAPKNEEVEMFLGPKDTPESIAAQPMGAAQVDPEICKLLAPFAEERSFSRPILMRRLVLLSTLPLKKEAQTLGELSRDETRPRPALKPNSGAVAGLIAAFFTLFGTKALDVTKDFGSLVAKHPFLAIAAGAGALQAYRSLSGPADSGIYTVDSANEPLYNNNWQSRFARMQARPVAVIKTGAASGKSSSPKLADRLFAGIPSLFLAQTQPGNLSKIAEQHSDLLEGAGLLSAYAEGYDISARAGRVIDSARAFFKTASLSDLDFLTAVPESEQDLIWDLAILQAAQQLHP